LDKHDRELKNTNIKLDGTREDLIEKVHDTKEDLKDRLGELDKFYQEANEEINTELQQVKVMAKDQVNNKEKELTDIMVQHSKKLENLVDENVTEMVQERRTMLENNEKQFNQIQIVICNYFERYDTSLKEM
jgi:seryl-tRNA synthetase